MSGVPLYTTLPHTQSISTCAAISALVCAMHQTMSSREGSQVSLPALLELSLSHHQILLDVDRHLTCTGEPCSYEYSHFPRYPLGP
jgi:hypothetical protein